MAPFTKSQERKEVLPIARNSFIRMTKIPGLKGRISYIISPLRQENLYAVHETTERKFWSQLAKCNQEEFTKSGTEGKCIEARELIIALPEEFVDYPEESMLDIFTTRFKEHYGVECISALHHNKRKTNYHIHLIFSERKMLEEPIEKIATRNMFYDESGKRVRTKKEILDEDGQMRKGCKVVAKGEVYGRKIFTTKNARFKEEKFLEEVKQSYTDLINLYVGDADRRLTVFSRDSAYLSMKKIGKNNPKEAEIIEDNERRSKWNQTVDRALVSGVPEGQIVEIRKTEIGKKASQSIKTFGKQPQVFRNIIAQAIMMLELLISKIITKAMEILTSRSKDVEEVVKFDKSSKVMSSNEIPEKPKMSAIANKCKRLSGIHDKLVSQSEAIYKEEKVLKVKEDELKNCKSIFKGKERRELQEQITQLQTRIESMKKRISMIVKEHGYDNGKAFMKEYQLAKTEYRDYKKDIKTWEDKREGNKEPFRIREQLEKNREMIKAKERKPKVIKDGRGSEVMKEIEK